MPPGDDDEVVIKGLFEDAITEDLAATAREARGAARALTETAAGGDAAAGGMDRASIAAGRLERELKAVNRAAEEQRLAQLRLTGAENDAAKIRQKGVLTAQETARVESMLSRARQDAKRATDDVARSTMMYSAEADHLGVRLLRTAGSVGFLTKAFSGLKLIATADVFSSLIGGVASLGSAGVAAVAGLAPLLGAAGAIPALGLAAVSAFGAVAMLAGGVMGAVKAMDQAGPGSAQAASALNRLGPSSATAAYEVYGLTYSLRGMREEAMRTALPYLRSTLGSVRTMLPTLRSGFVGVTQAMGETVAQGASRMAAARGDLDLIMQRNVALVHTLGGAVVDGLDAVHHIIIGAGPMTQGFADRFAGEMHKIDAELAANPQKVQAFFDRTFTRVMTFVHVLGDLGHGIVNLFRGAQPLTDHMGTGIVSMADRFEKWTASTRGQNQIRQFFQDAIPVVDSVGHLIGQIGHSLADLSRGNNAAGMINSIAAILPPLTALMKLIEKVANTVPGGNTVLGMLFLLNRFGASPRALAGGTFGLARAGTRFSRGLRGVEGVEGGFAGRTSQSIAGRLGARLGGSVLGGGAEAGALEAGGLATAGEGAGVAGGAGLVGLLAAVPVVGWIAAAVVAIGAGAYELYQHWKPFRDMIDAIGRGLKDAGEYIAGKFMGAVRGIEHAWHSVVAGFKDAYHWVVNLGDKLGHLEGRTLHYLTHPWEVVGLYTGGPVAADRPYLVGERGPELFATAGTMRVVGGDGAELLSSRTPGFVLPNEALRAIQSTSARDAAARAFPTAVSPVPELVPAGAGGGVELAVRGNGDYPPITIGPVYMNGEHDLTRAVKAALDAHDRERRDRR